MTLSLEDWHRRFLQQAGWTESLREHLWIRAELQHARRILEVGCGTGAVSESAARRYPAVRVVGVDVDIPRLRFARARGAACAYCCGDALRLPFGDGEFDSTFCHFALLWIRDPERAVREMARVTRPGGWVAAAAEPDYGARIDYPDELSELGRLQRRSLRHQGADPEIGRRLAGLFSGAGLTIRESGVLGAQIDPGEGNAEETELEWKVLKEDIGEELSENQWQTLLDLDRIARKNGRRVLFVPTFYATGIKS